MTIIPAYGSIGGAGGGQTPAWVKIAAGDDQFVDNVTLTYDASLYREVYLSFAHAHPVINAQDLLLLTSGNAGVSFDNAVNDYFYSLKDLPLHASLGTTQEVKSHTAAAIPLGTGISNTTSSFANSSVRVYDPGQAFLSFMRFDGHFADGAGVHIQRRGYGLRATNGIINGLRLQFASGQIDSIRYHLSGLLN